MAHNLIKDSLVKIARHQSLSEQESFEIFFNMLNEDEIADVQIAALLMGLRVKGETVDELTGAVKAMRHSARKLDIPEHIKPIDCCGTGGDSSHSLNISTAVSFVLAGCDVAVAKHGNRAATSKSGAADVLEALGVALNVSDSAHIQALEQAHICFLMAPHHHPALKKIAPIRQKIATRTIFNLLGPLANPAFVKRQLLGVFSKDWIVPVAHVLKNLGHEKAWVVHAENGMDELIIDGLNHVAILENGTVTETIIDPRQFGFQTYAQDNFSIKGNDATYNAKALMTLLEGAESAYRDTVVLNAAAALIIADKVTNMPDGIAMAKTSIDNGNALKSLESLVEISNAHSL